MLYDFITIKFIIMVYKLHQSIYFNIKNEEDNLHFNWLFRAISLVDKKYIEYTLYNGDEVEKEYHKERVFAYELYRQWANIIECECKERLVINAELDKIIDEEIFTTESNGDHILTEIRKYPDLVLHEGQESDVVQKIVCEIKRNTEPSISGSTILADLYKLACYMDDKKFHSGKKPFDYGVFILLNGGFDLLKKIRKTKITVSSKDYTYKQFKKEMGKHFENIICVIYDGKSLEYKTMKSLFK